MKSEKKVEKSKVELRIELEAKEWKECVKQAADKLSEGLNISGFRPGKAPLEVVINKVGETRVVSEAAEIAINKFYLIALQEHQLLPIVQPKISVDKVSQSAPLVFRAEITLMPEVELGDYSSIRIEQNIPQADPTRVEGMLKNIQRQQAKFNPVERAVQTGDWVEIDFTGKIEGKVFEGGQSKNHPLIVGDGVFLPDFEAALVGMKAGEDKTFMVTFPDDYHKSDLTGKVVEFNVKLHRVKAVVLPEINDELAKAAGNFATLQTLRDDVAKFLQEDAVKQETDRQKEAAIKQLMQVAKVNLPPALIEQEIEVMLHDLTHQLEHRQMTLEEYLKKTGATEEKLRNDWQEMAKERVLAGLSLNAFRKKEGIEATDTDVDSEIKRLQEAYPQEKDKIADKYQLAGERQRLKTLLSGQIAIERLWQIATQK
ncbi:MAG: trigger factor [Patescibacteria group bacterium]